jgi:hypothetical protein
MATVAIQPNAGRKNWPTVNIVSGGTKPGNAKGHIQVPIAQNTLKQFQTFQDSGGNIKGLKTIWFSSYTGPA